MLLPLLLALSLAPHPQDDDGPAAEDIGIAAEVLGLEFDQAELELMVTDVRERLREFEALRAPALANDVLPALVFHPDPTRFDPGRATRPSYPIFSGPIERPVDLESLAFASIPTLANMIRQRKITCVELTNMYLTRLRRIDKQLHCVITFTDRRALAQAQALDQELEDGNWRGPLHGIPWVAKDLLSVKGYPTTWGAEPFRTRVVDTDAAVVEKLDEAGAVLLAKVSLGALAWGDVWFGGMTRSPWDPEKGSSGSSAGSAATVAAGGAVFSIGSETLGSIVSPSDRCGASSLRPTFGRISRHGAMALSWSMDKLGPLCRSAQDASIVFEAIRGADPRDPTTVNAPFYGGGKRVEGWKVGYLPEAFENEDFAPVLASLKSLGIELVPVELPEYPVSEMTMILSAEAAAAFDDFSRGDQDDRLVRQERNAWPNVFRHAHLIPAVDYLRANRLRTLLLRDFNAAIEGLQALVHPSFAGGILATTNLTGHPTFVAPCGFRENGMPFSLSFTGQLFGETELMTLARAFQDVTKHHERHPTF